MRKVLAAVALGSVAFTMALAGPASADTAPIVGIPGGYVGLQVGDVQYGSDGQCVDAPVTVDVYAPDDMAYYDYTFESTYLGPTSYPVTVSGSGLYSRSFSDTFLLCPAYDAPGNYTGTLQVTFYDANDHEIASADAIDGFLVRGYVPPPPPPPAPAPAPVLTHSSALATSKIKTGARGWTIRNTVTYDGHAWAGHRVTLQVKRAGSWTNVRSVWSNAGGSANFVVTPPRGPAKAYRTVSDGGSGVGQKVSPTYLLKRR